ncbi:hypothetical protein LCGC14_2053370 [marine sediment metagenome]|uniref:Type II secretion system protein GspG C-terminal domain-containing protein n=1 Tax=marine sediment metagenome TaxID=412755 RepID=A0A0F9HKB0_9ZZZZ
MKRSKGFTLVELLVVVLIVAILATAAVPILRGQIDKAKWAEGKAFMGTIASSIRSYIALNDPPSFGGWDDDVLLFSVLGLDGNDFNGKHFTKGNFYWNVAYDRPSGALEYTVEGWNIGTTVTYPTMMVLNQNGEWSEM